MCQNGYLVTILAHPLFYYFNSILLNVFHFNNS